MIASLERSIDATSASSTRTRNRSPMRYANTARSPTVFDTRAPSFVVAPLDERRDDARDGGGYIGARVDRTAAVQELCVRDATTRMDGSIMNLFDG